MIMMMRSNREGGEHWWCFWRRPAPPRASAVWSFAGGRGSAAECGCDSSGQAWGRGGDDGDAGVGDDWGGGGGDDDDLATIFQSFGMEIIQVDFQVLIPMWRLQLWGLWVALAGQTSAQAETRLDLSTQTRKRGRMWKREKGNEKGNEKRNERGSGLFVYLQVCVPPEWIGCPCNLNTKWVNLNVNIYLSNISNISNL